MATVTIYYLLSETGRKASLLAGGDGREVQHVEAPAIAETVALATVHADGTAELHVGYTASGVTDQHDPHSPSTYDSARPNMSWTAEPPRPGDRPSLREVRQITRFDAPQTAEQLVAWETRRQAQVTASRTAAEAELALLVRAHEETRAAKREAEIQGWLARPDGDLVERRGSGWRPLCDAFGWDGARRPLEDPRLDVVVERARAEAARRNAETEAKEAAEQARKAAARAAELTDAETWVRKHGSPRLRKTVDAGLLSESLSVYREERLAHERPGFALGAVDGDGIRNPSEAALDALAEARKIDPSITLAFVAHKHGGDCADDDCEERGRVYLVGEWMGRPIYREV